MRVKSSPLLFSLIFGLVACGGSQEAAKDPTSEASSSEASEGSEGSEGDAPEKKDAEPEAEKPAEKAEPKAEEKAPASDGGPKLKRSPKDVITAPDVIFMFSFNGSEIKETFEKQCDEKVKDNPKKRAECMSKAKDKLEWDGMRFKQEKGTWYWSMVKLKGKALINVHKLPVEFGKEDDKSIVVKPTGKDEGQKRGGGPGETKIEVPNEYEIVMDDPKLGRSVYEAKIGLTEGK